MSTMRRTHQRRLPTVVNTLLRRPPVPVPGCGTSGHGAGILGWVLPAVPLSDGEVVLRAWRPADAAWYAATARDRQIQRWTSELADLTADAVRDAIDRMHRTGSHAGLAILDAGTGALLGNAALSRSQHDPNTGEISYWLGPAARGRGAAARAVRLLVDWAWQCGLHRVKLFTHIDNVASQRVAEAAGLIRERVVPSYRTIKGETWTAVIYGLHRSHRPAEPPIGT